MSIVSARIFSAGTVFGPLLRLCLVIYFQLPPVLARPQLRRSIGQPLNVPGDVLLDLPARRTRCARVRVAMCGRWRTSGKHASLCYIRDSLAFTVGQRVVCMDRQLKAAFWPSHRAWRHCLGWDSASEGDAPNQLGRRKCSALIPFIHLAFSFRPRCVLLSVPMRLSLMASQGPSVCLELATALVCYCGTCFAIR